jgi:hypothetical protein
VGLTPGNAANQRRHARETDRIVYSNGITGLSNYPGPDVAPYPEHIGRLGGLAVDALLPGHLLFRLGNGRRHIGLVIQRLTTEQFVPYSIGHLDISLVPADRFR